MTLIPEASTLLSRRQSFNDSRTCSPRFGAGLVFGMVGGYMGTVLMDLVMVITFMAVGQAPDMFFTMVGTKLGQGPALGLVVHNIIGTTAGLMFAFIMLRGGASMISGVKRGLRIGMVVGAVTIFLGCVPMAVWLGQSIPLVLAFATIPHMVWGSVTGMVLGYWMSSLQSDSSRMERVSNEPA